MGPPDTGASGASRAASESPGLPPQPTRGGQEAHGRRVSSTGGHRTIRMAKQHRKLQAGHRVGSGPAMGNRGRSMVLRQGPTEAAEPQGPQRQPHGAHSLPQPQNEGLVAHQHLNPTPVFLSPGGSVPTQCHAHPRRAGTGHSTVCTPQELVLDTALCPPVRATGHSTVPTPNAWEGGRAQRYVNRV